MLSLSRIRPAAALSRPPTTRYLRRGSGERTACQIRRQPAAKSISPIGRRRSQTSLRSGPLGMPSDTTRPIIAGTGGSGQRNVHSAAVTRLVMARHTSRFRSCQSATGTANARFHRRSARMQRRYFGGLAGARMADSGAARKRQIPSGQRETSLGFPPSAPPPLNARDIRRCRPSKLHGANRSRCSSRNVPRKSMGYCCQTCMAA